MESPQLRLGDLAEGPRVADMLSQSGLSPSAVAPKAVSFGRAAHRLIEHGARTGDAAVALFVPGRVEVLGKHTDYCGGSSIVAALEAGFCAVAAPSAGVVRVHALEQDDSAVFEVDPHLRAPPAGHWSTYPASVVRRFARNFPGRDTGMDLAVTSDLPLDAGMSSSSAFIVTVFLALARINDLQLDERFAEHVGGRLRLSTPSGRDDVERLLRLATYLGTIENGQDFAGLQGDCGVGTFGGSEDHTAMLCASPGHLTQFGYCPSRLRRRFPLPGGTQFVIGFSGISAQKTGEAMPLYNRASNRARAAVEIWRQQTGGQEDHLAAIVAAGGGAVESLRQVLTNATAAGFTAAELSQRAEHFIAESAAQEAAADSLFSSDLGGFGRHVAASQDAAERLLGNQTPETVALVQAARDSGAIAASTFGAGFGGSVWSLVEENRVVSFTALWSKCYAEQFARAAKSAIFMPSAAGPPAFELLPDSAPSRRDGD